LGGAVGLVGNRALGSILPEAFGVLLAWRGCACRPCAAIERVRTSRVRNGYACSVVGLAGVVVTIAIAAVPVVVAPVSVVRVTAECRRAGGVRIAKFGIVIIASRALGWIGAVGAALESGAAIPVVVFGVATIVCPTDAIPRCRAEIRTASVIVRATAPVEGAGSARSLIAGSVTGPAGRAANAPTAVSNAAVRLAVGACLARPKAGCVGHAALSWQPTTGKEAVVRHGRTVDIGAAQALAKRLAKLNLAGLSQYDRAELGRHGRDRPRREHETYAKKNSDQRFHGSLLISQQSAPLLVRLQGDATHFSSVLSNAGRSLRCP
jgi:hypothetical protein